MTIPHDYHTPVMPDEVIGHLITEKSAIYIDATLGGGGHTELILKNLSSEGRVISFDTDIDSIEYVKKRFEGNDEYTKRVLLINNNFSELEDSLFKNEIKTNIRGILFDLGVSSFQLDAPEKGFTYRKDSILDMRMNKHRGEPAYNILNYAAPEELERIFRDYAEDRHYKSLAKSIIKARDQKEFKTANDLVDIIKSFVSESRLNNVLSRIFQALRIETNDEMENLKKGLNQALNLLVQGGRIVVLTYHSLEDRIVKNFFKEEENPCVCPPSFPICMCGKLPRLKILTRKPIIPSEKEIAGNIRSRSAKLRVAERI